MTHQDTAAPRQTPLRGERDGRSFNASGSTKAVIDERIQRFRQGDSAGILDDYSEHAVMFTPFRLLKGRSEIKRFVPGSAVEVAKPGSSDTVHTTIFEGDYAYLVWSAETVDNSYQLATDTFVVQDGKIVVQSFAAKISPKH
jgi:predicted SnoaL-like aldol condensation-catalyzing enzyme